MEKTLNGKNAEWKKRCVEKRRMGYNVKWDKTPNGNHVESKKGQLGKNVPFVKNVASKKCRMRKHNVENGLKCQK
jgi:hypothetical protein